MADGKPVSLFREDCKNLTGQCKKFLNIIICAAKFLFSGYDSRPLQLLDDCSFDRVVRPADDFSFNNPLSGKFRRS